MDSGVQKTHPHILVRYKTLQKSGTFLQLQRQYCHNFGWECPFLAGKVVMDSTEHGLSDHGDSTGIGYLWSNRQPAECGVLAFGWGVCGW